MSTSRTTTTTIQLTASTSSCPADPPSPGAPINDEEDLIMREALARVKRVKAQKAVEETERKKQVAARHRAAQDACDQVVQAREQEDEVAKQRRKLAEAATARSQGGTSMGDVSTSPRRPVVEITRVKGKGKGKAKTQPIGLVDLSI
ncbi:hypothetical protein F5051DRAFT_443726 [Lentinula edodes]|nr:hypothetical protein F5051DRAFT_443726 [Lentinula edodes]